jgi:molybdopterin-guanine dinucleotide biosynthesis protein A
MQAMDSLRLGAVVLAGGTAARMGGADKASIELDGVTLLERALAATMSAYEVVVVGRQVPTTRPVTWTVEDPVAGGPAAGLLAGLDRFLVVPDLVAVLAVDMPRVHAGTVARLTWAVEEDAELDGAVLVTPDGRRQQLAAVYRHRSLVTARPASYEEQHGLAMHQLIGPLRLAGVPAEGDEAQDVDTWDDLRRLRDPGSRTNLGP